MPKVDPRDFLLNTDYEMDKIIFFSEGEINKDQTKDIPHSLGFTPLVFGVCAFNSDFSDPRSLPFEELTQTNTLSCTLYSYNNKVQIGYGNYETTPTKMYYRIYGFEPSDSHAKVGNTSKNAKNFILNTDYNYCKLCKKGVLNGSGNFTVPHDLGYIPQIMAWGETGGATIVIENSQPEDPIFNSPVYVATTTSNLIVKNPGAYTKIHYRIYYDEG